MKRFYKLFPRQSDEIKGPVPMDHQSCLGYAMFFDDSRLSIDVEQWRDNATHGGTLQINSGFYLLCFDIQKAVRA